MYRGTSVRRSIWQNWRHRAAPPEDVGSQRREMGDLVAPLGGIRRCPGEKQCLDDRPDRLELGDKQDPGAVLPLGQACPKLVRHGPKVVGNQNPVLAGSPLQHIGVRKSCDLAVRGRGEVKRRLPPPDRAYDALVQIGVSLKADQGFGSPERCRASSALARCSRSHSCGFSSDKGRPREASNSRSAWRRYSSTTAWWSK